MDKYDRIIRTYNENTMNKILSTSICILGNDKLSLEIIKLLILYGFKIIHELEKCESIVISVNQNKEDIIKYNNIAKSKKIKFINVNCNENSGYVLLNYTNYDTMPELKYSENNILIISIFSSFVVSETINLLTSEINIENKKVYWSENFDNIENIKLSKFLLIGCGAVGCEVLNQLKFLEINNVVLIDFDKVEEENLATHTLFSEKNIGKFKCEILDCEKYYIEKVGWDNKLLTDRLLKDSELEGVICTVDNYETQKFISEQCFNFDKPLFVVTADGNNAKIQPIIPFLTNTFINTNEPPREITYLNCVINNFPNSMNHTIQWAVEQFEFYNRAPDNLNKWLDNKDMVFEETTEGLKMNKDVYFFTNKYNFENINDCIFYSIDLFYELFHFQIKQLLHNFPDKDFWIGDKKCPKSINFDINNTLHIEFIEKTLELIFSCLNIKFIYDKSKIINEIENYKVKHFSQTEETKIDLTVNKKKELNKIYSQNINQHIEWINILSNIRASNYNIIEHSYFLTKGIIQKITPLTPNIASVSAACLIIELLKIYSNENYKIITIDLMNNKIISKSTEKSPINKIGDLEFNLWYKFTYCTDSTLSEFKKYYEDIFKSEIIMITYNNCLLYSNFLFGSSSSNNLLKKFSEIEELNIESQIELSIMFEDDSIEIPQIIINI